MLRNNMYLQGMAMLMGSYNTMPVTATSLAASSATESISSSLDDYNFWAQVSTQEKADPCTEDRVPVLAKDLMKSIRGGMRSALGITKTHDVNHPEKISPE